MTNEPEVVEPFHFEDHVLNLEDKLLVDFFSEGRFSKIMRKIFRSYQPYLDSFKERYRQQWNLASEFFHLLEKYQYCQQTYEVYDKGRYWEKHLLRLSADKRENFTITGKPEFLKSEEKRTTKIPVEKFGDDFDLILHGHPQAEILPFSRLQVDYQFNITISLGERSLLGPDMTKKVHKTYKMNFRDKRVGTWYGRPGRIYFRPGDQFHDEIHNKLTGVWTNLKSRPELYLSGIIHQNGEFLYNGQIDSTGSFPFFIRGKDNEDNSSLSVDPRVPETINV
ncbi:hypothetical protein J4408_03000 [Candidatus Pacearchaeota archaeon]|nr:hypothetical protein [Candidatus Pacearchaeota archaeon]